MATPPILVDVLCFRRSISLTGELLWRDKESVGIHSKRPVVPKYRSIVWQYLCNPCPLSIQQLGRLLARVPGTPTYSSSGHKQRRAYNHGILSWKQQWEGNAFLKSTYLHAIRNGLPNEPAKNHKNNEGNIAMIVTHLCSPEHTRIENAFNCHDIRLVLTDSGSCDQAPIIMCSRNPTYDGT